MIETLSPIERRSAPQASPVAPDLSALAPEAVVCVPTFRRPEMLRATLQSLVEQRAGTCFAVVVVDNDAPGRAGAMVANSFFDRGLLAGFCVLEPRQGNCHAINRAFGEARARFPTASHFLMIDDDERADPAWLDLMVATARDQGADVVGGPVVPEFPAGTPAGVQRHPIYWPAYEKSGPAPMIYGSGNCLVTRRAFAALADPDFDPRYNFLGGGDTDFFTRCRAAGLRAYWRNEARIVETVPPERLRLGWILRRGLRIGAINFRIDANASRTPAARARLVAKNLVVPFVALWRALKLVVGGRPPLVALHPLVIALGRILGWLGRAPEQYRSSGADCPPKATR